MIKSLYVRTVLVFIGAVILSLVVAFSLSGRLYVSQIEGLFENQMIRNGNDIIATLQQSSPENREAFLNSASIFPMNRFEVYNSDKQRVYAKNNRNTHGIATAAQIERVLNGGIYRGKTSNAEHRPNLLIGLPMQLQGHAYALFIGPPAEGMDALFDKFRQAILTVLGIALAVGSLLILVFARYIVQPLRKLTAATRRLAAGDFSVAFRSKRKDEVGQLTNSFHYMAGELDMLDRMRTDFVNNVSHEIQSPLTSISGFTKALKHKRMDEAQRLRYLTIIEEESERLSRMGHNLLRLSSLQSEDPPIDLKTVRLDEQLRNVVIACEPQWKLKKLDVDLALTKVTLDADEDLLSQVWTNLLHNAIKFTPESGRIRITLTRSEDDAVVVVTDNGIGIAEADRTRIFTPFYKADQSRNAAVQGNGLGLPLAKRIVELHQGEITVDSEPGRGTTFTLRLPMVAASRVI
jgi:signal transduction histidine kinase